LSSVAKRDDAKIGGLEQRSDQARVNVACEFASLRNRGKAKSSPLALGKPFEEFALARTPRNYLVRTIPALIVLSLNLDRELETDLGDVSIRSRRVSAASFGARPRGNTGHAVTCAQGTKLLLHDGAERIPSAS